MGFGGCGGMSWLNCTSHQTDNHTNTSSLSFTGRVLFRMPNQQCQPSVLGRISWITGAGFDCPETLHLQFALPNHTQFNCNKVQQVGIKTSVSTPLQCCRIGGCADKYVRYMMLLSTDITKISLYHTTSVIII